MNLVGPEHVGIGLDYVFDREEPAAYLEQNPETFPEGGGYTAGDALQFVSPLQLRAAAEAMHELGYRDSDVRAILGGNVMRVAHEVWQPRR